MAAKAAYEAALTKLKTMDEELQKRMLNREQAYANFIALSQNAHPPPIVASPVDTNPFTSFLTSSLGAFSSITNTKRTSI